MGVRAAHKFRQRQYRVNSVNVKYCSVDSADDAANHPRVVSRAPYVPEWVRRMTAISTMVEISCMQVCRSCIKAPQVRFGFPAVSSPAPHTSVMTVCMGAQSDGHGGWLIRRRARLSANDIPAINTHSLYTPRTPTSQLRPCGAPGPGCAG